VIWVRRFVFSVVVSAIFTVKMLEKGMPRIFDSPLRKVMKLLVHPFYQYDFVCVMFLNIQFHHIGLMDQV
jgi:hypothetical protein